MKKELLKSVGKHEKPSTNKLELKIYEARNKDCDIPLWRTYLTYSLRTLARK